MFVIMAAELALGVAGGVVTAALFVRRARSTGQGRVLWSLPIALTGVLLARAHVMITSASSEPVQWASLMILFLGGAIAFFWSKKQWHRRDRRPTL